MQTLTVTLSDAVIKRHMKDPHVYQLKDPRYPLYLRYNTARTGGSWLLVHYAKGKQIRRKVGAFPVTTSKVMFSRLPEIKAELVINPLSDKVSVGQFERVADVLNWYQDRASKDRNLSKPRKTNIKSVVNRHLVPMLGDVAIEHLDHRALDTKLMWPLQERYSLSNVRGIFAVLKVAFKQAKMLNLVEVDPVAGLKFGDFINATISPKDAAIRPEHVPGIVQSLSQHDRASQVLVVLMLAHGTRIGETRLTRWDHIDFDSREWFIPSEHTKTKQAHRIPLTDSMVEYLKQYQESQRHYNGVYLFPANRKGQAMSADRASQKVKAVSGGKWSAHDLRKVARTVWADLGVDYMVGELLLNHALSKLDKTYIHTFAESQKRQALTLYHDWLNGHGLFFDSKNAANPVTTLDTTGDGDQARHDAA
ncbi:integrase [Vibrio parahaemolyticus]|uniref:tyrosine-type recombinase/integrase n=1 Tax=Vibrio parahaemolyticus TaxID=670 RepID=UPI00111E176B|nr:site-specific integrase [Vibrio parahaemolyticus]TOK32782.1 integrase [Vibrio parahaemolyticus]TOK51915.1 integrase [Vibrio parahaemolyticus]